MSEKIASCQNRVSGFSKSQNSFIYLCLDEALGSEVISQDILSLFSSNASSTSERFLYLKRYYKDQN